MSTSSGLEVLVSVFMLMLAFHRGIEVPSLGQHSTPGVLSRSGFISEGVSNSEGPSGLSANNEALDNKDQVKPQ